MGSRHKLLVLPIALTIFFMVYPPTIITGGTICFDLNRSSNGWIVKSGTASHCDVLISPPVSIGSTGGWLTFATYADVESQHRSWNVQISTNNGETWSILEPLEGYDEEGPLHNCHRDLGGDYNSAYGEIEQWNVDLSNYPDNTIRIRYWFGSDTVVANTGVIVNDVCMSGVRSFPHHYVPYPLYGDLDHFDFSPIAGNQIAGDPFSVFIEAQDENGNLVEDFEGTVHLSDVTGTLSPTAASFLEGQWAGFLTITQSSNADSILAWYSGITGSSNSFAVMSGPLDRFELSTINDQFVGVPFPITIIAVDEYNNVVEDFNNNVMLLDLTRTITPSVSGNFVSGLWIGDVTIFEPYRRDQITAIGSGHSGESNHFNVLP